MIKWSCVRMNFNLFSTERFFIKKTMEVFWISKRSLYVTNNSKFHYPRVSIHFLLHECVATFYVALLCDVKNSMEQMNKVTEPHELTMISTITYIQRYVCYQSWNNSIQSGTIHNRLDKKFAWQNQSFYVSHFLTTFLSSTHFSWEIEY